MGLSTAGEGPTSKWSTRNDELERANQTTEHTVAITAPTFVSTRAKVFALARSLFKQAEAGGEQERKSSSILYPSQAF